MALKININFKNLPSYIKVIISILPAIIIAVLVTVLLILPDSKEIKALDEKISSQENEIAKNQAKAAKLSELTMENERLRRRLEELKQQLPEEKEVSDLLKQVSDLCIRSGLKVSLWKPEQRKTHPSGIVYEIPVKVELAGSYHSLGYFFSSLTKLSRVVNISDIKLGDPKPERGNAMLKIAFTATTFSSVPEEEIGKTTEDKPGKRR
ncbi:MAG: type 4a pilus biogenesis protein PilO [Nitrospirae bacterium]|jgi:type IV pilus assembly protein PilO|nr:type 4a pilus biogenesis protein PilO [Nitrospirota bacterium]